MKYLYILIYFSFFVFNYLLSHAQPSIIWSYNLDDMSFANSAAADIDNDNKLEIVFGTYRNDGKIYALNAEDGSMLWQWYM